MRRKIYILLFLFVAAAVLYANPAVDTLYSHANKRYDEGMYTDALTGYRQILDTGFESAELYYNMGNAYFKMNEMAWAILFYERAKKLNPNDEDINFNLGLAQNRIVDKIEAVPVIFYKKWWNGFLNTCSANAWARITLVFFSLTLVLSATYLFSNTRLLKKIFFTISLLAFLLTIFSFTLSYQKYYYATGQKEAIIFEPAITVKSSPNKNSVDLFVVHEGTKVFIFDQVENWIEIKIANGSVGWLPIAAVKMI